MMIGRLYIQIQIQIQMYIRTQIKGLLDDDRVHCAGSPSQDVIGRLWMDCQYLKASSAKEPIVCKRMQIQTKIQIHTNTEAYTCVYTYIQIQIK